MHVIVSEGIIFSSEAGEEGCYDTVGPTTVALQFGENKNNLRVEDSVQQDSSSEKAATSLRARSSSGDQLLLTLVTQGRS